MNFTELSTAVQTEMGLVGDTSIVTTTRCGHWVNEAQRAIVYDNPGLWDCHVLDTSTLEATEDEYELDLADFTTYPVCHVLKIRYVKADPLCAYWIQPYPGGLECWDEDFPYIPMRGTGYPQYYVRRGNVIELDMAFGADAAGADIWLEYCKLPPVMTGTNNPVLTGFDECLIAKAKAYAYGALGPSFHQAALVQHEYANALIAARVRGEADFEQTGMNTYKGP